MFGKDLNNHNGNKYSNRRSCKVCNGRKVKNPKKNDEIKCASINTGSDVAMCKVPKKVRRKESTNDFQTYAYLSSCSQETFILDKFTIATGTFARKHQ